MPAAGSSRKRRHERTAGLPTRKAAKGGDSRRMRAVPLHETDGLGGQRPRFFRCRRTSGWTGGDEPVQSRGDLVGQGHT